MIQCLRPWSEGLLNISWCSGIIRTFLDLSLVKEPTLALGDTFQRLLQKDLWGCIYTKQRAATRSVAYMNKLQSEKRDRFTMWEETKETKGITWKESVSRSRHTIRGFGLKQLIFFCR